VLDPDLAIALKEFTGANDHGLLGFGLLDIG
jgi:hypothetical protein